MDLQQGRVLANQKVMLAVQNKALRELLTPIFKQLGATEIVFGTGLEMMKQLDTFKPQIIFCEAMMDQVNGIAFTRQVRQELKLKIPCVLLADMQDGDVSGKGKAAGASDVLGIPFSVADLIKVAKRALEAPDTQVPLRFGPRPKKV